MQLGNIKLGDRVRVHLYDRRGILFKSIEGVASDFSPETEVAPGVRKNLIWVTQIEGYERPNDVGEMQPADEGWFADTDVEKVSNEPNAPRLFAN